MVIYKITNLVNNKSYIGKTKFSIDKRFSQHINCSQDKKRRKSTLHKSMFHYGKDNFKIEIIDWATNETELDYKEWISIYIHDTLHPNGYNLKEGGSRGYKHTDFFTKKVVKSSNYSKVVNTCTGKIYKNCSDASRKEKKTISKVCENAKGSVPHVSGVVFKYLKDWDGVIIPEIDFSRARKIVDVYSGDIYNSIKEAAETLSVDPSSIIKGSLQNHTKIKNKKFEYLEDWDGIVVEFKETVNLTNSLKVVCLNNKVEYPSAASASRDLNLCSSGISKVCKNKKKHIKGYRFQYV